MQITWSRTHDNGDAGLQTYGAVDVLSTEYSHHDVVASNVAAYRNVDEVDKGNGIVLGDVDGALIEWSRAWENRRLNNFDGGGPVGIWAYDSNDVTIQRTTSFRNTTGTKDDGGFDLDGGVTNSVMQSNLSYDNAGPAHNTAQESCPPPGTVVEFSVAT